MMKKIQSSIDVSFSGVIERLAAGTINKELPAEYGQLLGQFVNGGLQVEEFQENFLRRFKQERRPMNEEIFDLLEGVFGDVDSFSRNRGLLAKRSEFYLNEQQLRERAKTAWTQLQLMKDGAS